ncbi:MAG TPA: LLM class F420-dependent oxidoreductase [bacterium]|nr:LLM class F420-dependent oxidoreductase [bacterium]
MHVGLMMFATAASVPVASLAQRAEALGYDSLWLPDHPAIPVGFQTPFIGGGPMPEHYKHMLDPFVALAAAAGASQRLKLGTAITLVPEREPLVQAKQVATLDLVSQGRFLFGIGAGWLREESELLGVDFPRRWGQTRDFVRAMQALWTQEEASHDGPFTRFPPVWSHPKPVQKPHPPILIAGIGPGAPQRVAEYGDGWIPFHHGSTPDSIAAGRKAIEAMFRERGRNASRLDVTLFGCRPERAELRRWADAGVTRVLLVLQPRPAQDTLQHIERLAAQVL